MQTQFTVCVMILHMTRTYESRPGVPDLSSLTSNQNFLDDQASTMEQTSQLPSHFTNLTVSTCTSYI